jgi:hypothetical protein
LITNSIGEAVVKVNLRDAWREGVLLWGQVFKRAWGWLVLAMIVEEVTDVGAGFLRKLDERFLISGLFLVIGVKLFLEAFMIVIINQLVVDARTGQRTDAIEALRKNLKYVFIESTRAIVPVLLKSILFIVPGVIEAVRLYFVPYVAQFDREYKSGQVDALERSRQLVRGSWWPVAIILLLAFVLTILPSLWLGSIEAFEQPFKYVMVFFLAMVFSLYSDIVVYCMYKRLVNAKGSYDDGHKVSVPGSPS